MTSAVHSMPPSSCAHTLNLFTISDLRRDEQLPPPLTRARGVDQQGEPRRSLLFLLSSASCSRRWLLA